jgi:hypothetical protein
MLLVLGRMRVCGAGARLRVHGTSRGMLVLGGEREVRENSPLLLPLFSR